MYYGPGAGAEATASSVIADLVDVARAVSTGSTQRVPYLGFEPHAMGDVPVLSMDAVRSGYYLRIHAKDHPGVLAKVAAILSEHSINIESIMQKESEEMNGLIPIILLTHTVQERQMNLAIADLQSLPEIEGKVVRIRAEHFKG